MNTIDGRNATFSSPIFPRPSLFVPDEEDNGAVHDNENNEHYREDEDNEEDGVAEIQETRGVV